MVFELCVYLIYGSAFLGMLPLMILVGEKIKSVKNEQREYERKRLALRQQRLRKIRERNLEIHRKSA